jgi:hypothetical protein
MMTAMSLLPPLSVLDLSPIVDGGSAAQALAHSLDLAQHAEAWGCRRYWVAEHHNMDGVASSATAVLVGYIAGGTKTIRVGSGGVASARPSCSTACATMRRRKAPQRAHRSARGALAAGAAGAAAAPGAAAAGPPQEGA